MRGPSPRMTAARKPPSRTSIMIRVTKLKCPGGYRLHATFSDGTAGEHDSLRLSPRAAPWSNPCAIPLISRAYSLRMARRPSRTVSIWTRSGCAARLKRQACLRGMLRRRAAKYPDRPSLERQPGLFRLRTYARLDRPGDVDGFVVSRSSFANPTVRTSGADLCLVNLPNTSSNLVNVFCKYRAARCR